MRKLRVDMEVMPVLVDVRRVKALAAGRFASNNEKTPVGAKVDAPFMRRKPRLDLE